MKKISFLLKILTIISALLGIFLSLINAKFDGYSHWTRRMLYFTFQSNVWILIAMILSIIPSIKDTKSIHEIKYIFSVSIILTAIIYLGFLAPLADKSYHSWAFNNLLTHAFTPAFAIMDFFIEKHDFYLYKRQVFLPLIPPLCYFLFSSILFYLNIDFGRGDNFPYFFLNLSSPAGFFGFSSIKPFIMGSFYWIIICLILIYLISLFFAKMNNILLKNNKKTNIGLYYQCEKQDANTCAYGNDN